MDLDLLRLRAAEALLGKYGWPQASGNETVVEVYLAAMQHLTPSRSGLLNEGFSAEVVDYALLLLHNRGVLDASNVEALQIFLPDEALTSYATELETFAITARSAIEPLTQLYRQIHATTGGEVPQDDVVRVIREVDDVVAARQVEAARARRSVLRMLARNPLNDAIMTGEHPVIDLLTEGAQAPTRRLVVDGDYLDVDGVLSRLVALDAGGTEVRIARGAIATLLLCDDHTAIVDILNVDPSGFGGLVVQHKPLIHVVRQAFDVLWAGSTPLPGSRAESRTGQDAKDLQILALLATGASDSTIARQLRISQRTVERRLRTLMDGLGVETRFQLGMAVERGQLL